jgi:biopolymer transport protein TolQ
MPLASTLFTSLQEASLTGRVICVLLVCLSVASWVAMTKKFLDLRAARRANADFRAALLRSPHPLALFQEGDHHPLSPMFMAYFNGCREMAFYLLGSDEVDGSFSERLQKAGRITTSEMAMVREAMDRCTHTAAVRLENGLGVVATALSGAPVLGLLGTVWGVMESFSGVVSLGEQAALGALAPGLASAMLTTIAGLIVAIPSMFGYNYLVGKIRDQLTRVEHFSAEFAAVLDRHFVDHRTPAPGVSGLDPLEPVGATLFSTAPATVQSVTP